MTQLELFPLELTDSELAELNKRIYEICCECYPHDEFFEVEQDSFVEV
jgi:hypothetical protein